MPTSLKSRFNGNTPEVIDYARTWGISKAMDRYQVRDYIAFKNFLEEETGDKNWGLVPLLGKNGSGTWAEELLDAFTTKINKMEAEKQRLETELHSLKVELEYFKGQKAPGVEFRIQKALVACQI